jgi:hypothetical protein
MDLGQLKEDIKKVIKHMPAELQLECAKVFHTVVKHMPTIEKIGPLIAPLLMPHVQAGAVEFAMGMIDRDGLDKAMREAFAESGIVIPGPQA